MIVYYLIVSSCLIMERREIVKNLVKANLETIVKNGDFKYNEFMHAFAKRKRFFLCFGFF